MSRVVVVGAGAMGLAAAYRALKNGHHVDLVEAAHEPGGNAGHFLLTDAVGVIASSSFGNASQPGSSTVPVGALETLHFTTGAATAYALDFDFRRRLHAVERCRAHQRSD
jgi:phytoene dehydrogenase-like protein